MPAVVLYPNSACLDEIELMRTDLVDCLVKLFTNDVSVTPSILLADLDEADFSGYAEIEVAALLPAYLDPEGGASAQIATVQFNHSGGPVANTIFGAWVETAAGDLRLVIKFEEGVPMQLLGDSIPLDIKFNFSN